MSGAGVWSAARRALMGAVAAFVVAAASAAPTIVFKLDDLSDAAQARDGFERAMRVIEAEGVRASFGIITRSCVDDGKKSGYYAQIRRWAESGRIEV